MNSIMGKNFFKNPVYNEPPLYDDQPASHPSMPPKKVQGEGLRGIDGWLANRLSYRNPSL
jgi:hypothetical protein